MCIWVGVAGGAVVDAGEVYVRRWMIGMRVDDGGGFEAVRVKR